MREKFSEYCEVISGFAFKSKDLLREGDIPVIKIGNISNGGDVTLDDNTQYVLDDFLAINEKYHVKKDDILISLTGSHINQPNSMVGRTCRSYCNKEYLLNQRAGKIIPKSNSNADYLYYLFSSRSIKENIVTRAYGAANQVNVSPTAIGNIKWDFPDKKQQEKIGAFLKLFDELIQNNIKRIKLLEQMAENLYKEWFVRFRFPGYKNVKTIESRIDKIPESFNVVKMQDIVESYIGGGWGSDEEDKDFSQPAFVIRGADFPNISRGDISTCPFRYHKKSNYEARELQEDDIIIEVSGGTAEQPVGRTVIVTKDIIEGLDNHVICASFCKQMRIKKKIVEPLYFFYWMQFMYDTRMIDRFQLQSTGIINFKFEYFLRKGDVMIPTEPLMQEFVRIVKPIRDEMSLLAKRNVNLIKQRDLLLPRLISGKLEV